MNNPYRTLMSQQSLSEQANAAFYEKLNAAVPQKKTKALPKVIVIAACFCLLIPTAAIAADHFWGISLITESDRVFLPDVDGDGYDINYPHISSRPISDFSPEIQRFNGYKSVGYNTWDAAEAEIGIDLINNSILSDKKTYPENAFVLEVDSGPHVSGKDLHHCIADYTGKDGQLYYASVSAMYTRNGIFIDVRATVTADHPAISPEDIARLHWHGFTYPKTDVKQIAQKQYTAKNGLTATIVEVNRTENQPSLYEATFSANGVSYWIRVNADSGKRDKDARKLLTDILEEFSF